MTTIYLIRHALTPDVGLRLTGRNLEIGLSDAGKEQAIALAHNLAGLSFSALYSSPQTRARQTAAPIAAALGLPVTTIEAFNEIDFGQWTGLDFAGLAPQKEFGLFNTFRSYFRVPGGETMAEAQLRMLQGIAQLTETHTGQTIGIVSHSDMIKATLAYFLGTSIDHMQRIEVAPASVSGVAIYPETARVFLLNHCGAVTKSV